TSVVSIIAALVLAMIVCDGWLRWRRPLDPNPFSFIDRELEQRDDVLGWTHHPAQTVVSAVAGRKVTYTFDVDGNRVARASDRINVEKPTVVFAGESILFGHGLEFDDTIPARAGRELGVQTVNLGVRGYANDQAHLRLLTTLGRLRRPMAAVTLFLPAQL